MNDNIFSVVIKYRFEKWIQFECLLVWHTHKTCTHAVGQASTSQLDVLCDRCFAVCVLFYYFIREVEIIQVAAAAEAAIKWMNYRTKSYYGINEFLAKIKFNSINIGDWGTSKKKVMEILPQSIHIVCFIYLNSSNLPIHSHMIDSITKITIHSKY